MPPILVLNELSYAYGERVLFDGLNFSLEARDKIGLIGDNGVGKSSLLRLIAGLDRPHSGEVALQSGIKVVLLEQVPVLAPELTIQETLEAAFGELVQKVKAWEAAVSTMDPEAERLFSEIEALGGFDYQHKIESAANEVGLSGLQQEVGSLSGGQAKRVAIAKMMLSEPDLILWDEPTNHLDVETIAWLERWIHASEATHLIVTHDRAFLDRAVTKMAELRSPSRLVGAEKLRGAIAVYDGSYQDFLEARAEEEEARSVLGQKRSQYLKQELEWARRQPSARRTKSKSRLEGVAALSEEVRGLQAQERRANFDFAQGSPRLSKTVISFEAIRFGYGDKDKDLPLVDGLTLQLKRGECLGVIGRNGIGKSSFLKVISGELAPWSGERVEGEQTVAATFDQHRQLLDERGTIREAIAPDSRDMVYPGGKPTHIAAWLARFGFDSRHLVMPVSSLSGGERNRLAMARFLLDPANLLLFDEPTNDLDIATLGLLEEALRSFDGTVVVVSHDRWFLDRVADRILVFEELPPSERASEALAEVFIQPGGWTSYERLRLPELESLWQAHHAAEREKERAQREERAPQKAAAVAKLSYREQREKEELEAEIPRLEAKLEALHAALEDPAIWQDEGARGAEVSQEAQEVGARLEAAMERWMSLEERG